MKKFYIRLATDRFQIEEVNESTFNRRKFAVTDDGGIRFNYDEYLIVEGGIIREITLKSLTNANFGFIARLCGVSIPTGTSDFLVPLGPVMFKNRGCVVLVTPNGNEFKQTKKAA